MPYSKQSSSNSSSAGKGGRGRGKGVGWRVGAGRGRRAHGEGARGAAGGEGAAGAADAIGGRRARGKGPGTKRWRVWRRIGAGTGNGGAWRCGVGWGKRRGLGAERGRLRDSRHGKGEHRGELWMDTDVKMRLRVLDAEHSTRGCAESRAVGARGSGQSAAKVRTSSTRLSIHRTAYDSLTRTEVFAELCEQEIPIERDGRHPG